MIDCEHETKRTLLGQIGSCVTYGRRAFLVSLGASFLSGVSGAFAGTLWLSPTWQNIWFPRVLIKNDDFP